MSSLPAPTTHAGLLDEPFPRASTLLQSWLDGQPHLELGAVTAARARAALAAPSEAGLRDALLSFLRQPPSESTGMDDSIARLRQLQMRYEHLMGQRVTAV